MNADPHALMRAILVGILISVPIWLAILAVWVVVMTRGGR